MVEMCPCFSYSHSAYAMVEAVIVSVYTTLHQCMTLRGSHLGVVTPLLFVLVGTQRGTVSVDNAVFLVLGWVYPIRGEGTPEETVRAAIENMHREDVNSLNCKEFVDLCDCLVSKSTHDY